MCIEKAEHRLGFSLYVLVGEITWSVFQGLSFDPIAPTELRSYIAHARTFCPSVPSELADFIASAYAEMRQDELDAGEMAMVKNIWPLCWLFEN